MPASEVRSARPVLRSWLAEHATGVCSAGVNGVTTAEPAGASELSCISDRPAATRSMAERPVLTLMVSTSSILSMYYGRLR